MYFELLPFLQKRLTFQVPTSAVGEARKNMSFSPTEFPETCFRGKKTQEKGTNQPHLIL